MKSLSQRFSSPLAFWFILALGIILRLLFLFAGGKIYYGKPDFHFMGDTLTWFISFINLSETGTYTINPAIENGKFFRPPGYSFLFGIFYLLTFKNYLLAAKILVYVQLMMDVFCIWLIRQISLLSTHADPAERKLFLGNAASFLYAIYPFAIAWFPVLYAETPSLFFLLLSVYFFLKIPSAKNALLSGVFGGLAALTRLQCIFALPFIALIYALNGNGFKRKVRLLTLYSAGILITYGLWPARNYFLHGRAVFSQDLHVGTFWSLDYLTFMNYVFAVRTDHTPVYQKIIRSEKPEWPAASYLNKKDSILLDSVAALCSTCGTGFSYFMQKEGFRNAPIQASKNCDQAIAGIFTELTKEQKQLNGLNYWLKVPLNNLEKCFFKFSLYGDKSAMVRLTSTGLFIYRSAMIFLGLLGIYLGIRKKIFRRGFAVFLAGYMLTWYLYLSFFYRNMEMRYLLHTDVLLLIPAAFVFTLFLFREKSQN